MDDQTPPGKGSFREPPADDQGIGQAAGRDRFRIHQFLGIKADQIPGFPQEQLSGGCLICFPAFENPFAANADHTVSGQENPGIADTHGNDCVVIGYPAFGKEDPVVPVEGENPGIVRFKSQMDTVRQAGRIIVGLNGTGVYTDPCPVLPPRFSRKPFQNGTAGPRHQREPGGSGGTVGPFLCKQAFTVAETLRHPAGFSISELSVAGVMALAAPQECVLQAAADIAVVPELQIVCHLIHHGRGHGMNMRIGHGGDAAAAAGPAGRAERRYFDRGIVTELESELIIQRVPEMIQQDLRIRRIRGAAGSKDRVQVTDGPDIAQDSFRINILIDIQRPAVALFMADIRLMVPFLAVQEPGEIFPFTGKTAQESRRGQAPRSGEGIVFKAGSGLFRKNVGVFTVRIAALLGLPDHTPGKREPVLMPGSVLLFASVCLQDQVHALADQIRRVPGDRLFVIPPAAVAPASILLRSIGQAVPGVQAGVHDMVNAVQRLPPHFPVMQAAGGKQHRHGGGKPVCPGDRGKEAVFEISAPVKDETGITMGRRDPGVP